MNLPDFPYTCMNSLNLDWIIKTMRTMADTITTLEADVSNLKDRVQALEDA